MAVAARGVTHGVEIRVVYVGHATVLIEFPWLRVLTDPFFRLRLGPLRRHGRPPDIEAIGRIDIVLVSHGHADHFDRASLRQVPGTPIVVVPAGLGAAAKSSGHRVRELRSGEELEIAGGRITAVPARHWRSPVGSRAEALGYVVDAGARVYFAGDTSTVEGIARKAGKVDIALVPVGTWGPHRAGPGHLDPEGAARVVQELRPVAAVPIHWGTLYPVGLHRLTSGPLREPGMRFYDAVSRLAPEVDVRVLAPGDSAVLAMPGAPAVTKKKR